MKDILPASNILAKQIRCAIQDGITVLGYLLTGPCQTQGPLNHTSYMNTDRFANIHSLFRNTDQREFQDSTNLVMCPRDNF